LVSEDSFAGIGLAWNWVFHEVVMKTMKSRLLFVDKDREFLQQVRQAFMAEYDVNIVSSGREAAERLRRKHYDVVVSSVELLETRGKHLFRWLHRNRLFTVPVLLESGVPAAGAATAVRESAFDYLMKPVELNQLAYCVRRALEYRRLALSETEARQRVEKLGRDVADRIRRATKELLLSNEHLSEVNRAKDQFLAAMSHELRTPLTAITGAVRILQSPKVPEAKTRVIMEILDRNVATLKRLLDDLLDCSRIASGKLSLELSPVNLNDCVAAALETMRSKALEANVALHAYIPPFAMIVNGNPLRLQQIVWNLIDNAIKFTPPGGFIAVSVAGSEDNVELMVCDSGTGLSDEDLKRIFEPFAQVHESDAQKKGGLGLGLALVQNLTRIQGGTVYAQSDGIGRGARFVVTLPLAIKSCPVRAA
jgi:signal transduction histidine kinase